MAGGENTRGGEYKFYLTIGLHHPSYQIWLSHHRSRIGQHFVGVHDPLGVEYPLDLLHQTHRRGGLREVDEVPLLEAETWITT